MRLNDRLKARAPALFLAALLGVGLTACGGSSGGGSDELASVSLRLTDAPASLASALVVTFTEVHLKHENGAWSRFPLATPKELDLLQLQGTTTAELLPAAMVPEGNYTELRLFTSATPTDNYIELTLGGGQFPLTIPSGSSSGIKIKGDMMLTSARDTTLIADFDLLQSVKLLPTPTPEYQLHPVIRLVKLGMVGHVSGMLDHASLTTNCSDADPATDNAVYVFKGHNTVPDDIDLDAGKGPDEATPVTTARIDYDAMKMMGTYEAAFLPAGKYTIAITCNANEEELDEDDDDLKFFGVRNVTVVVNNTLFL